MVEESTPFVEPMTEPEMIPESMEAVVEEQAVAAVEPEFVPESEVVAEPEAIVQAEPAVEMIEPEYSVDIPPATETESAPEVFDPESAFEEDIPGELWPRIPLTAYAEPATVTEEPSEVALGDLDYGITKANDNLWNIAEKLRQGDEGVSIYQVMMALLKSNPDAFIDNNVHRLKVGHVLRIDDPSALTSLSRKEAADSFIEQTETWNSYRQQVAASTDVQPIMAGADKTAKEVAPADSTGELTLSSPEGKSLTAGGGANEESLNNDLATMQEQLRQAKSDAGTMRTRNVALNDKLQSLEDELNRLQRSLSVKDDELAALQQQLSNLNKQPVQAPAQKQPAAPAPVIEKPAAEIPPAAKVVEKPAVTEKPKVTKPVEEVAKPKKSPVKLAEEISQTEKTNAEPGIMDTIMGVITSITASATGIVTGLNLGSDSLLFIVAPIVLVFLIIAMIVIKRRRQGDNFQESILTGAATAADDAGGAPSGDSTTFSEESSFLSDFAMSGASAIEADDSEVDPLTEADVFMAYGRYEAAEERLNEAVQNEPDRMELRAKLLELHHATQNKVAFEAAAEDFYASLGGSEAENPLWEKVVSMGTEIAPENPLFNQGGGGVAADIPATAETPAIDDIGMGMTDSQVMDIGLETGVFEAADLTASPEAASDDMDFNLDIGGDEAMAAEPAVDLDFNLDMGTTESTNEVAPEPEAAGLDFNLDIGGDTAAEEPAADIDFNLDMGTEEVSADSGGLDFDLNIGGNETDDAGIDLNLDASDTADADLGGGDEVGTKLDLAKAYIDMGDPEGARSILDEVMDEGSSTQKEEAQSLLGQIA
jgi:pilus assembly protein FimV